MANVAVIGSGAWGTTLARLVALEQVRQAIAARVELTVGDGSPVAAMMKARCSGRR